MSAIGDKIRAAQDIEKEIVDVPQWGVTIEVRSMSGMARSKLYEHAIQPGGKTNYDKLYPAILMTTCFDPETGEPVFSDADTDWLNEKSAGPVERLAQVGMRLSGLTEGAVDTGKGAS